MPRWSTPDGYVEIRDRFKDVIISGGENISSIEVEGALLRHAAILEVAVVGMPHPTWGESPNAFVVLRGGMTATEAELRAFARESLAHFKVPSAFHFVSELPKTATGKIQKFVLRGRARRLRSSDYSGRGSDGRARNISARLIGGVNSRIVVCHRSASLRSLLMTMTGSWRPWCKVFSSQFFMRKIIMHTRRLWNCRRFQTSEKIPLRFAHGFRRS